MLFRSGNATEWTAQGYIGGKWQDVFESLVSNSNVLFHTENDTVTNSTVVMDSAAHGIVFIDEIDKICNQTSEKLEVIKRVQEELLAVIQGTKLKLNNDDILDTSNILFIAGGAFPQLVSSYSIGSKDYKPITITPKKLERYGMLPELAGRLCNIVQFSALSKNDLKKIILTSKNSPLLSYTQTYKIAYDIDLVINEDVIDYVAEVASHQSTGARAINAMISQLMKDKTFKIKDYIHKPLIIDKKMAVEALSEFAKTESKDEMPLGVRMMYT